MQEFSGLDFDLAIGEVYGLRVWRMDDYGRLRARNLSTVGPWKPGINVAKCHAQTESIAGIVDPSGKGCQPYNVTTRYGGGRKTFVIEWSDGNCESYTDKDLTFGATTHAVPDEKCQCGFYAYSDPRHEEAATRPWIGPSSTPGRYILGIIRGTGRTLIGTKGFRCEKAEIVALLDPTAGGELTEPWRQRQLGALRRVYPDVPLLRSREALIEFAPLTETLPDPTTEEFWALPA